jgi:hypothetical protein
MTPVTILGIENVVIKIKQNPWQCGVYISLQKSNDKQKNIMLGNRDEEFVWMGDVCQKSD